MKGVQTTENGITHRISKHKIGYRDLRQATAATVAPVDVPQILVDSCSFRFLPVVSTDAPDPTSSQCNLRVAQVSQAMCY